MRNVKNGKSPVTSDITNNRLNNFDQETRFASSPTRYLTMFPAEIDPTDVDCSKFVEESPTDPLCGPVEFFNSRLDLAVDLPSTLRNRWVAK